MELNHSYQQLLADACSSKITDFKVKLVSLCDRIGLLQYRPIRLLFSITDQNIQKINDCFDKVQSSPDNLDNQFIWFHMRERWKISVAHSRDLPLPIPTQPAPSSPNKDKIEELLNQILNRHPNNPQFKLNWGKETVLDKRTVLMKKNLAQIPDYDQTLNQIEVEGKNYQVVTSEVTHFTDQPLVSCGSSSSREMILFDANNSPLLNQRYNQFERFVLQYCQRHGLATIPPKDLLMLTDHFMSHVVFPKDVTVEEKIDAFIAETRQDPNIAKVQSQPCIPIDDFIKKGVGVCRHHALVGAFLIEKFNQKNPQVGFKCHIQIMRDDLEQNNRKVGAHAWVNLITENGDILLLDSLNNFLGNLNDLQFRGAIENVFGKRAIKHQIKKAEIMRNHAQLS
jgi:hypothetical protein